MFGNCLSVVMTCDFYYKPKAKILCTYWERQVACQSTSHRPPMLEKHVIHSASSLSQESIHFFYQKLKMAQKYTQIPDLLSSICHVGQQHFLNHTLWNGRVSTYMDRCLAKKNEGLWGSGGFSDQINLKKTENWTSSPLGSHCLHRMLNISHDPEVPETRERISQCI